MTEYANFRQHLDSELRTLNVERVRNFLIAEGQWRADQPADPEFAMWMMIAGSPTLQDLHERAREWLVNHGHEEDARTFLTGGKKQGSKHQAWGQKGARPGNKAHSNRR
jgi:hypothetical protein